LHTALDLRQPLRATLRLWIRFSSRFLGEIQEKMASQNASQSILSFDETSVKSAPPGDYVDHMTLKV